MSTFNGTCQHLYQNTMTRGSDALLLLLSEIKQTPIKTQKCGSDR